MAALCLLLPLPAHAGAVVDRIRSQGVLHCAATERPGYAEIEDDKPVGRAADLCRSIAEGVLGPNGRYAFRLLDLGGDFDHVRDGEVELAFLEPRLAAEQKLDAVLVPAGEAYRERFSVMIPTKATAHRLADLGGLTICFMIGDPIWPLIEGEMRRTGTAFRPFGFSEEVEMKDAYNVGRCDAVAGVDSELDEIRADQGVKHVVSRLIEEKLGADPVVAMVPPNDSDWADIVRSKLGVRAGP